jgi:carboxymethylenebutenolidase
MPNIKIKSLEAKEFSAYCAIPVSGHGPAIIVIQEIFGITTNLRKICDNYAAKGYIAVCPDLFWRQEPGIVLDNQTPEEWDRAMELYKGFDTEAGVRDLLSTLAHIRGMPECNGKVGAVGYCLGGKLAYLMAARSDLDAVVSYYGVELDKYLDEVHDIRMPLILHIAALDSHVPPEVLAKITKAMARNTLITVYVYEGVDHAFARPNGQNFNQAASDLANSRTQALFARHIQS